MPSISNAKRSDLFKQDYAILKPCWVLYASLDPIYFTRLEHLVRRTVFAHGNLRVLALSCHLISTPFNLLDMGAYFLVSSPNLLPFPFQSSTRFSSSLQTFLLVSHSLRTSSTSAEARPLGPIFLRRNRLLPSVATYIASALLCWHDTDTEDKNNFEFGSERSSSLMVVASSSVGR